MSIWNDLWFDEDFVEVTLRLLFESVLFVLCCCFAIWRNQTNEYKLVYQYRYQPIVVGLCILDAGMYLVLSLGNYFLVAHSLKWITLSLLLCLERKIYRGHVPYMHIAMLFSIIDGVFLLFLKKMSWFMLTCLSRVLVCFLSKSASRSETEASLFSLCFFQWFKPMINTGSQRPLEMDDVWDLYEGDTFLKSNQNFEQQQGSFERKLLKSLGYHVFKQCLTGTLGGLLSFTGPLFVHEILDFLQSNGNPAKGLSLVLGLFLLTVAKSIIDNQTFFRGRRLGVRVRSVVIGQVYSHALKTKSHKLDSGLVLNLIQTDASKIVEFVGYIHYFVSTPIQIFIAGILMYRLLQLASIVGLCFVLVCLPLNALLGKKLTQIQISLMKVYDARVSLTSEVFGAIKTLKFFAWEKKVMEWINLVRHKELNILKRLLLITGTLSVSWIFAPHLVLFLTLIFYSFLGNSLVASKVFTIMSLFGMIKTPIFVLPIMITRLMEVRVSFLRIKNFLSNCDYREEIKNCDDLEIKNGSFGWDQINLYDINVKIPTSKFTIIIGKTASGKTSLLHAFLGQISKLQGDVFGSDLSIVLQEPFIFNSSVRENVLFGQEYNKNNMNLVLNSCAMDKDLAQMPGFDLYEVGERGSNLSGGQKSRLELCRAAYSNQKTVLMDDVLSALDSVTAKHCLEHCILGIMKTKTRVLVTHATHLCLSRADYVIELHEGRVKQQGPPSKIHFSTPNITEMEIKKTAAVVVEEEERCKGRVKFEIYWVWIKAAGGLWFIVPQVFQLILQNFIYVYIDVQIKKWTDGSCKNCISSYVLLLTFGFLNLCFGTFLIIFSSLTASKKLGNNLIKNLLFCKLKFFESTPHGRILNRISKDLQSIDRELGNDYGDCIFYLFQISSIFVFVCYLAPVFLMFLVPLGCFFCYVGRQFLLTSRELKRLDSLTRSPIFSLCSESLRGVTSIQAYKQNSAYISKMGDLVDYNHRAFFYLWVSNRWLSVRTDMISALMVLSTSLVLIFMRAEITASFAGLVLTYCLNSTDSMMWVIRTQAMLEMDLNSVERVLEYCNLEKEPNLHSNSLKIPLGGIKVDNLLVYYADSCCLKHISFEIKPGERVAICGRTGAGKSTLVKAIFRFLSYEGTIKIDNVNINSICLYQLRSKIAIVPQEPILFTGTIRSNLDIFKKFTDAQLILSLNKVHLSVHLDDVVLENGSNFSVGTRQLISLARALLQNTKILILDEATSSVDSETDLVMQRTIRQEFKNTLLTIAHRLETIIDYDRVLVLENGNLVENDSPKNLLQKKQHFYQMCLESGNLNKLQQSLY